MQGTIRMGAARILVVDDNRDMADTMALLLRMQGYDVAVAYDGRSAMRTAQGYAPDVVLMDLSLPDIDGRVVAENLRNNGLDRASFIAVSGSDPDEGPEDSGFADHLVKPVQQEELVSLLARLHAERDARE